MRTKKTSEAAGRTQAAGSSSHSPHADLLALPPPVTPRLNIVMQIIGSRGDVQPFLSLALVLANEPYCHRVRVATHACFEDFVNEVAASNGLVHGNSGGKGSIEFFPLAGDPAVLMSYMVRNPGLIPSTSALTGGEIRQRRQGVWEILLSTWASCHQSHVTTGNPNPRPFIADLIVANPPGFGHIHCGERLGVPVHIMFTMPWAPPTSAFPHPLANLPEGKKPAVVDDATINYLTYTLLDILTWQGTGDLINKFRTDVLRLDGLNNVHAPTLMGKLANEGLLPHTYCWSPALIPKPKDWDRDSISVSGFWFLDLNTGFVPPPALAAFLGVHSEKPLVYIGFGSIVAPNPEFLTTAVLEGIKAAGVRALVSKGWGTIDPPEGYSDPDVFFLGNTPHDWLFPRVALAVHHGGAGTTAAAIKAGIPSAIVPFFGDQHFWGQMVTKRGAGGVLPSKELTKEKLAALITSLLVPQTLEKARELGEIVNRERGEEVAARGLLRGVQGIMKGCEVETSMGFTAREAALAAFTIVPQHPPPAGVAEGRQEVKRKKTKNKSGINISARVAHVLWKQGLIDVDNPKEVKLMRWMEWDPWVRKVTETDPATGGAGALLGTIISMGMAGGVDFDRDAWFGGCGAKGTKAGGDDKGKSKDGSETPTPGSALDIEAKSPPVQAGAIDSLNAAIAMSKPIGNIITAGLKSPIDFTLSVSRGFHHLPTTLFADETVRHLPPVHSSVKGIGSGVNLASKHLAIGFYDGITGLVTQPVKGLRKGGVSGFFGGIASGIGGVVAKPAAGIFGVPGYLGMGVMKEVERLSGREGRGRLWEVEVRMGRLMEGKREVEAVGWGEWEKGEIVRVWREMVEVYLREDLAGRRAEESASAGRRGLGGELSAKVPTRPGIHQGLELSSSSRSFLGKFGMHGGGKEKEKAKEREWEREKGTERMAPGNTFKSEKSTLHQSKPNTNNNNNNAGYDEDEALERALRESLSMSQADPLPPAHHQDSKPPQRYAPPVYSPPIPQTTAASSRHHDEDDDPELRAAILASLSTTTTTTNNDNTHPHTAPRVTHHQHHQDDDDDDDENLRRALQASQHDHDHNHNPVSSGSSHHPHPDAPPTYSAQQTGTITPHGHELLSPAPVPVPGGEWGGSGGAETESEEMHTPGASDDDDGEWDGEGEEDDEDEDDEVLRRVLEASRVAAEEEERERERRRAEVERVKMISLGEGAGGGGGEVV